MHFVTLKMQIIVSLIIIITLASTAQSLAGNGRRVRIPVARLRLSPSIPSYVTETARSSGNDFGLRFLGTRTRD
jgi:hypothetical protein